MICLCFTPANRKRNAYHCHNLSNLFSPNEETKAVTPLGRPKGQIRPGDVEEMVRCDPGMDSSDPNINVWAVDSFTLRMLPQQKPDSRDSGREGLGRLDTCNQEFNRENAIYIQSQGKGKMGKICQLMIQKNHQSKSKSASPLRIICHLMSSSCLSEASACLRTWARPDS